MKLEIEEVILGTMKGEGIMEKVAIYHGYKVKMFEDEQEAKSWLLET